MTEIEIETLAILKDHCGVMNPEQALLSTIEQEAIIAVYEKDKQNIQAVSKTKIATIRRDRFLMYALLLEKEENLLKTAG